MAGERNAQAQKNTSSLLLHLFKLLMQPPPELWQGLPGEASPTTNTGHESPANGPMVHSDSQSLGSLLAFDCHSMGGSRTKLGVYQVS